jgi:hypothetical protein
MRCLKMLQAVARRQIFLAELARVRTAHAIELLDDLEHALRLEILGLTRSLDPMRELLERLERVGNGQLGQQLLRALLIRHGMVGLGFIPPEHRQSPASACT